MNKRISYFFTGLLALVAGMSAKAGINHGDVPGGQLPKNVEPTHYQMEIKLDPESPRFSGKTIIDIKVKEKTKVIYLHGQDLNISKTKLTQGKKSFDAKTELTDVEGVIKVSLNKPLNKGSYKLAFVYDAPFNENLEGLYRVKDDGKHYAFTQMQSIYARYAFPSFDEPRFKTKFDVQLIVPESLVAVANTPETSTKKLGDGWKKVSFETSKPSPTYLWAIAVGDFDVVEWKAIPSNEIRNRTVPLRGIATKGKGKKLKYALENTQDILEAMEDYFQSEYPFRKLDIVAVPDFGAGAMENSGLITYREQLLLLDENSSVSQKRSYKSVHAHELAHMWFGNLVTPKWWNDIWLNEAFATWMAATALERKFPGEQWRRSQNRSSKFAMDADSIPSARKVRNPIKTNSDIVTAFDGITYSKGGGVLSMIENFMGEVNFQKGVQVHMKNYEWGTADALDFFNSIASVLKPEQSKEVVKSFRNFVEQAGVPLLNISQACDDERSTLDISQERYAPLGTEFKEKVLWSVPACMSYEVGGQVKEQCEVLAKAKQKVKLKMSGCADWVMPNVRSAGYYRYNFDADGWKRILTNLDKVSAVEANSVLDSMGASFNSGKMEIKDLMEVIPSTLESESWEVMTSGLGTLGTLISYADEKDKPKLRALAADIYRSKADALGFVDNTEFDKAKPLDASQLRGRFVRFMAFTAEDKAYREKLTEMGKSFIGFKTDNKINEKAVIPALRTTAMSVAVQELGKPYVDALIVHLNNATDGTFRQRIIGALTATEEPKIGEKLIGFSLSPDIRDNEKSSFLFGLLGKKELDSVMWPWLKKNFDHLMKNLPTNYQAYAPYLFMGECESHNLDRLGSFLKPKLPQLIGADRNFTKAQEYLQQCLAHKAHVKPQINSYIGEMSK